MFKVYMKNNLKGSYFKVKGSEAGLAKCKHFRYLIESRHSAKSYISSHRSCWLRVLFLIILTSMFSFHTKNNLKEVFHISKVLKNSSCIKLSKMYYHLLI